MEIWSVKLGGRGPELAQTLLGNRIIQMWIAENVNDLDSEKDDDPYDPESVVQGGLWDDITESTYVVRKVVNL